eukprot:391453-Rhodomonas_salina.1
MRAFACKQPTVAVCRWSDNLGVATTCFQYALGILDGKERAPRAKIPCKLRSGREDHKIHGEHHLVKCQPQRFGYGTLGCELVWGAGLQGPSQRYRYPGSRRVLVPKSVISSRIAPGKIPKDCTTMTA